jgi:hypothetical protein
MCFFRRISKNGFDEDKREAWQIAIDEERERIKMGLQDKALRQKLDDLELYQQRIGELGKKFKCHCCGNPSKRPGEKTCEICYDTVGWEDDWSKPGDLQRCEHCGQWTCESCLYKGICKTCALKIIAKY